MVFLIRTKATLELFVFALEDSSGEGYGLWGEVSQEFEMGIDGDVCEVDLWKVDFEMNLFELLSFERFFESGLGKVVLFAWLVPFRDPFVVFLS